MKKNFRYIVLDLDGTLLSSSKEIDEETLIYLKNLRNKRYHLILASGRHYFEIEKYSKLLDLDEQDIVIACDGERIFRADGTVIYKSKFLKKKDLINISSIINATMLIVSERVDYLIIDSKFKRILLKILSFFNKSRLCYISLRDKKLNNLEIEKIITSTREIGFLVELEKKYSCHIIEGSRLEIKPKEINKYTALIELQKRGLLCLDELLYLGNDYNDIECFRYHKYCIAMKNAPYEMKSMAFYVTDSNDSQGVLKALKKVL